MASPGREPWTRRRDLPGRAVPVCEFREVLVDGGAADAEQPGDAGDAVAGQGEQVAGLADLLSGHCRRPPQALAAGAGGIQALAVDTVFPPTNKTFAMTQSHWFRIEDGKIIEHWANRDDLGMAKQLGWIPPTPAYLFKMARAKRRARRS